jgi:hypothetical protein
MALGSRSTRVLPSKFFISKLSMAGHASLEGDAMTYRGIIKGRVIELDALLPYPEGQPVSVSVEPLSTPHPPGSPEAIRQGMRQPPHLNSEDVNELERAIAEGKLPMRQESVFDEAG